MKGVNRAGERAGNTSWTVTLAKEFTTEDVQMKTPHPLGSLHANTREMEIKFKNSLTVERETSRIHRNVPALDIPRIGNRCWTCESLKQRHFSYIHRAGNIVEGFWAGIRYSEGTSRTVENVSIIQSMGVGFSIQRFDTESVPGLARAVKTTCMEFKYLFHASEKMTRPDPYDPWVLPMLAK